MPVCIDVTHIDQDVAEQETAVGILYAVRHGASVINISGGGGRPTGSKLVQVVGYALAHNVVIVAAAGNVASGDTAVADVARIPGVVAVTGVGRTGSYWAGSAQGLQAGVAAPAVDITSTDSTEKTEQANASAYGTGSGTSDATAIVSGVVALIRAKYPRLDAVNVINRLVNTADDKGAPGRDPQYGFGVVDPVKALTADVPSVSVNPLGTPPSPSPPGGSGASAAVSGAGVGGGGGGVGWLVLAVLGVVVVAVVAVGAVAFGRRRARVGGAR
jgi:subtilisin family serine protease